MHFQVQLFGGLDKLLSQSIPVYCAPYRNYGLRRDSLALARKGGEETTADSASKLLPQTKTRSTFLRQRSSESCISLHCLWVSNDLVCIFELPRKARQCLHSLLLQTPSASTDHPQHLRIVFSTPGPRLQPLTKPITTTVLLSSDSEKLQTKCGVNLRGVKACFYGLHTSAAADSLNLTAEWVEPRPTKP